MKHPDYHEHQTLLQWLIGIGLLVFLLIVAWQEGLFELLFNSDRSRLSLIIIAFFLLVNIHIFKLVLNLSRERNAVAALRNLLTAQENISLDIDKNNVSCCGQLLPASSISRHLKNLDSRLAVGNRLLDTSHIQSHLLSALDKRVRGQHKYGWLVADLMIKLGLIGTVIGFILMLSSVATIEDYDIATMQDLLRNMSSGMQVALFTTLTGLSAGLILGIQYQFLDRHAEELLADIEELSEIYFIPALVTRSLNGKES